MGNGYINLAVSEVTNTPHREESRTRYVTIGVRGVHMWAKWLHNTCRLRDLQRSARG